MISVIIPVYNLENYIEQCIKSVINQTYANLEIIIIDDGSTDNSGNICDLWQKQDNRISVIHKKNSGLSDARNIGLDLAKGDYISFVDGDDWIHPQMYEILLRYYENENIDMVCCKLVKVEEKTINDFNNVDIDGKYAILTPTDALLDLSITDVTACNKLYKRKLFNQIRYPHGRYHEDEWVIHRLLYECNKIVSTDAGLYYYMMREGSITHTFSKKRVLDGVEAYIDRVNFVIEKEWKTVQMRMVKDCLNHIIWAYYQENSNKRKWHLHMKKYYRKIVKKAVKNKIMLNRELIIFALSPRLYIYKMRS